MADGELEMGIAEEAPLAPDIYGLVEYFVTSIKTEIIGPNVRIVVGSRCGNSVRWLYSAVAPADDVLLMSHQLRMAAEEAFNLAQMMDHRRGH
jgi:hypothetical protein